MLITQQNISQFQEKIGYKFNNPELLIRAFTHCSYVNETDTLTLNNQRLEFLGDAVISLVISQELFTRYPEITEGTLSATRASLVSDSSLSKLANSLGLGELVLLGHGEENSGGRQKQSVLADTYEALAAAIFLDGGFHEAKKVVLSLHQNLIEQVKTVKVGLNDFKSKLQHITRKHGLPFPTYKIIDKSGPLHSPTFVAEVNVDGECIATGVGNSKKKAEQDAAEKAISFYEKL